MIQAGQGFSKRTLPLERNMALFFQARKDYIHCRDISPEHSVTHFESLLGLMFIDTEIADTYGNAALGVYVGGSKAPAKTFNLFRNTSISYSRDGLALVTEMENEALDSGDAKIYVALADNAKALFALKSRIMRLSLSNVPRNDAELKALLAADPQYGHYFTVSTNWGIPQSVLCEREHHAAVLIRQSVPDYSGVKDGPASATIIVAVGINLDGSVSSAHLNHSSTNEPIDEAVLKSAYSSTYRAATRHCTAVPGQITLRFTYP